MNCDAAFVDSKVALAFVVRDDAGLLVVTRTRLLQASSAYEARTKAIECAISLSSGKLWSNMCFSSDA